MAKALFRRVVSFFRDDEKHCSCCSTTNRLSDSSSTLTGSGLDKRRICKHRRWKAFAACYIHIIPLAMTALVVSVNFASPFLEDAGAQEQNLRLNALQFAAKLHEIFMVASLSLVAITYIQYELLVGRGLPLNSVLAGFQITSFISFFTSRPWEKKLFSKGSRALRIRFIVLLLILVVLCATIGPSAAILILPATGWWKYSPSFSGYFSWDPSKGQFFVNANESMLWPSLITSASFLAPDCTFRNTNISDSCPTGGFSILNQSIDQVFIAAGAEGTVSSFTWNLTLPIKPSNPSKSVGDQQIYSRYIEGISQRNWTTRSTNSVARTSAGSVDKILDLLSYPFSSSLTGVDIRWEMSLLNGTKPLSPQTLVLCTDNGLIANGSTNSPIVLASPSEQLNFTLRGGGTWTTDAGPLVDLLNQPGSGHTTSMWIEPPRVFGNQTPSIGVATFRSFLETDFDNDTQLYVSALACSVYASWQPVDVYLEPATDTTFHLSTVENWRFPWAVIQQNDLYPIQLDIDWANSELPCNETIDLLHNKFMAEPSLLKEDFGYCLAVVITDALARVWMDVNVTFAQDGLNETVANYHFPYFITIENFSAVDQAASIPVFLHAKRFGYGYTTDGITRRISIGVLLIYVFIVMMHVALVLWYGWICVDLASLHDLIAVAMRGSTGLSQDSALPPAAELRKNDVTIKLREMHNSELKIVFQEVNEASKAVGREEQELLILPGHMVVSDENGLTARLSVHSRRS